MHPLKADYQDACDYRLDPVTNDHELLLKAARSRPVL